ncbi:MAG: ATP synthase F0 subunit A [Planctomycetaceae bacterium]|nr:ATP synthase F0 subunit A [Planctomycetaceae bacterium]
MADPILHIKDAYFFEVPKVLWPAHYESKDAVPEFLTNGHEHASLDEFNHAMDGKILIPQPFGTLKNLHEPASGFCISKFMLIELLVAVVLIVLFKKMADRVATCEPVKGRFNNLIETFLLFIRDEIARPAIGHDGDKFVPLLWTFFFFILGCNLMGMIPFMGTPTGAFGATVSLASVTFATVLVAGTRQFGPIGFWKNQVPSMELPWPLAWLKLVIFVIEVLGLFIKHAVLGFRLLANMVAGHLVLLGILAVGVAAAGSASWYIAGPASVVGATLFSCLELFVAFLQAYIFTFLSALFIGAAVHSH